MSAVVAKPRSDWVLPLTVSAMALAVLFAGVPYCVGYGRTPASLLAQTWSMWLGFSDWAHGMLVFPLAGGLLYLQRTRLAAVPVRGSGWGLPVLAFAGLLYWLGFVTDLQYAGYFALQLFLAGLVLWFLGIRFFREVFFILLFLTFAWPFVFLDEYVAFPLRLFMSASSEHLLNAFGIATVRSGTAILSAPDVAAGVVTGQRFSVDVADPSSGMHSLFALTMIAALYAIAVFRCWWQVLLIVLAAFPLAVFGNLCRILMLTFGTVSLGRSVALGTEEAPSAFHTGAGFLVYLAALGGILVIGSVLKRSGNGVKMRRPT
jgi:exosortase